ncbi:MAG: hypothetical protein K940chlam7_00059 [Chlamydiae bacterium]|nr:hypothetical protein [Chlamydiota bacterium]
MRKTLILTLTVLGMITASSVQASSCCSGARQEWYMGAFGGANFQDIDNTKKKGKSLSVDMDTGYYVGGYIGYSFPYCPWRIEGEVGYRRNEFKNAKVEDKEKKLSGDLVSWTYMANLIYDLDLSCCGSCFRYFTPYIGGGLGYACSKSSKVKLKQVKAKTRDEGWIYQGIAGLSYDLCYNADISLEYRFMSGEEDVRDHGVGLSLKQYF